MLSHFFNSLVATLPLAVRNSGGVAVFVRILWVATLLTMSIRARIVVAVALHQIDYAPDTKPGSKCYNKGLQNVYCAIEKCHKYILSAASAAVRQADKRRSAYAAAQKNRPLVKAAVPALRKFCGAAVFSCRGVRLLPLCAAPESRGAYHVADIDICDCFDSSFRCPAVLPDGYYSDLREVNSLRSKVFASRKFTKG